MGPHYVILFAVHSVTTIKKSCFVKITTHLTRLEAHILGLINQT